MALLALVSTGILAAAASTAAIDHKAVGCVEADKFPRFEARLTPADTVGRARVFFRPQGVPAWYAVSMAREADVFAAFLPKAKKSLRGFQYYIEVADTALGTSRTQEYSAKVTPDAGGCAKDLMALSSAAATVLLEVPAGAPLVPLGFSAAGVTPAGAAAATGAAAGASGGGGLSTGVIVAGAGAVAAGGAVVATTASSSDDGGGKPAEIRGMVYGNVFAEGGMTRFANPVAGARVSTSLDPVTAVTGSDGKFHLVTQTPEKNAQCYTITISATGYPTLSLTGWEGSVGPESNSPATIAPEAATHMVFGLSPRTPSFIGGADCR